MTRVAVEIDDGRVRRMLNALIRAGADLSPTMRAIAGALEAGVDASFEHERAPDGTPWAALSPVTAERREKSEGHVGRILFVSGTLRDSITSAFGADFAAAGTNVIYAPTHQFGARKGQFGATKFGAPIPWGDIPARPFLGLSADTENQIVDLLRRHLAGAAQ